MSYYPIEYELAGNEDNIGDTGLPSGEITNYEQYNESEFVPGEQYYTEEGAPPVQPESSFSS